MQNSSSQLATVSCGFTYRWAQKRSFNVVWERLWLRCGWRSLQASWDRKVCNVHIGRLKIEKLALQILPKNQSLVFVKKYNANYFEVEPAHLRTPPLEMSRQCWERNEWKVYSVTMNVMCAEDCMGMWVQRNETELKVQKECSNKTGFALVCSTALEMTV